MENQFNVIPKIFESQYTFTDSMEINTKICRKRGKIIFTTEKTVLSRENGPFIRKARQRMFPYDEGFEGYRLLGSGGGTKQIESPSAGAAVFGGVNLGRVLFHIREDFGI